MAAKTRKTLTCDDCYFKQEGLCALPRTAVCPTFRAARSGVLAPPRQPELVARPTHDVAVAHAA